MSGDESERHRLTSSYQLLGKEADSKGITLGFPSGPVTKQTFLKLISEPATVAFVRHSHGEYTPFATGNMLDANGDPIMASEVSRAPVSNQLQFAALLGCAAFPSETMRQARLRALRLDGLTEPVRRLYAFGGTITAQDMHDFNERSTFGDVGPYRFHNWLDMIKQ